MALTTSCATFATLTSFTAITTTFPTTTFVEEIITADPTTSAIGTTTTCLGFDTPILSALASSICTSSSVVTQFTTIPGAAWFAMIRLFKLFYFVSQEEFEPLHRLSLRLLRALAQEGRRFLEPHAQLSTVEAGTTTAMETTMEIMETQAGTRVTVEMGTGTEMETETRIRATLVQAAAAVPLSLHSQKQLCPMAKFRL